MIEILIVLAFSVVLGLLGGAAATSDRRAAIRRQIEAGDEDATRALKQAMRAHELKEWNER